MNQGHSLGAGQPEAPKLPHAVFISYSNEDKAVADAVCAALEAGNVCCWIAPRDVHGGRPYSGQITQAIRQSRVLLLILTGASNRSKHVLREVERAAHCQNHLLTFRVEPISPGDDLAYFLGADQWVDGFRPLPPSQHFPALVQHTRKLLRNSTAEQEPEEQSDTAPETFAHFRISRHPDGSLFKLGKGGMGVTYKAIDSVLNRPVALKVIAAELLRSPQARARFLREAQAAALIHHPHVATIFHFGEEEDSYFYAMEFVEGEDLERYVGRRGPLAPATALRVVLQVAQALEAAQARALIHRDIKPGNIMAVANRAGSLDVKLIDFGLAKGAASETLDAARITRTQDFVGSPAFASPEQCETKKLDIRSDIYSLGVTLWYLLSGKRPFSGSVGEVMIAQVIKPPPFDQLTHVPEPVLELLRRMLAKNPDDRFQTPQDLQDAVEAVAARLASEFGTVPERIVGEAVPQKDVPGGNGESQVDPHAPAEPVLMATLASPLFDSYLGVEVGAVLGGRYRLLQEEREGNGGRLFLAQDEKASGGQSAEVGLKLLHPGITADPGLIDLLENEIGVIGQAVHPNLVRYFGPERSTPFLVREWVHGFLLYDLLRWRRSLSAAEMQALLGPLAATLDFVSDNGLGLVDVSVRKILVACPKEIAREDFPALARGNARDWKRCALKLNPLSLAPLLFRSRNGWDRQTVVPTSRVLSMTQVEAGIRGSKAVRLYGRLVYELLSGHASARGDSQTYTPLPELNEAGNETLRRACVATGSGAAFRNCQEFWKALNENIAATSRLTSVPELPPATSTPSALPPPSPAPPPKRRVMVGAILGGALISALAIIATIRFGSSGPGPSVTPTPPVTVATSTTTPTAAVTPMVVSTPTPSPTPTAVVQATPTPVPTPSETHVPMSSPSVAVTPAPTGPQTLVVPDKYSSIQSAIDAAKTGDTVLVKAGVYHEALTFKEGIELRGENPDTTIVRFSAPATANSGAEDQCPLTVRHCQSGKVLNLTFEQDARDDRSSGWKADAIALFDSSITIENCHVTSAAGAGIGVNNPNSNPTLRGNQCRNNAVSGIAFQFGASGTAIENICERNNDTGISVFNSGANPELVNNQCRNNALRGISFENGGSGKATGNICEGNQTGIAVFNSGSSAELVNNQCRNNALRGISFGNGGSGKATGNICEGNQTGIAVFNSGSSAELVNNQCRNNALQGIYFGNGGSGKANDNVCEQNKGEGILVSDSGSSAELVNNQCRNNSQDGMSFWKGASGKAVGNTCQGNEWSGISINGSSPKINGNRLFKNKQWGLIYGNGAKPAFESKNQFAGNAMGEINSHGK
jgi:parallel beta-helix repeat protein